MHVSRANLHKIEYQFLNIKLGITFSKAAVDDMRKDIPLPKDSLAYYAKVTFVLHVNAALFCPMASNPFCSALCFLVSILCDVLNSSLPKNDFFCLNILLRSFIILSASIGVVRLF